jgi:hypothetical protein
LPLIPVPASPFPEGGRGSRYLKKEVILDRFFLICSCLLTVLLTPSDGYAVPGGKSKKVVPVDSVLTSGEPESRQVPLFNPSQDGHLADAAVPGDDAGGKIFRVNYACIYSQVLPPLNRSLTLFTW